MAVYKLLTDVDRYDVVLAPRGEERTFMVFDGRPLAAGWKPPRVELQPLGERGDFLSFHTWLVIVDERAWRVLRPLVQDHVESLPADLDGEPLYALNVRTILDCLDEERSTVTRYSSGELMNVEEYVFLPGCIGNTPIFKLKDQEMGDVFVTDAVKDAVERHHLIGAEFVRVA